MTVAFRAIRESDPGPKWAAMFAELWPAYRKWWSRDGLTARPTYRECRNALVRHMPEITDLYDELCELGGGGDLEARFLSFYCPPPYLSGCSQAVWSGDEALLVRNYDYDARAFDAISLHTSWQGRRVMGTSDGMFGVVDGMNDQGLAVSLTFGGRREVGTGFGVPLILRYILQTCETAREAGKALQRIPCHMSYNVTVLDAARNFLTVYLAPDRPAIITHLPVATNHQEQVEWKSHARLTATVERQRYLLNRLAMHPETQARFLNNFLQPPLYSIAFGSGFGTLYTAAYWPERGAMQLLWPQQGWEMTFDDFQERILTVSYPAVSSG
ncbi:MAG: C45 family peptidase [Pseudomonadota bacterium]